MADTLPIAGWYPDPELADQDRWWDGAAWSEHRRPTAGTVPIPPPPVAAPSAYPVTAPSVPVPPAPYPAANGYAAPYRPAAPATQNTQALVGFILALTGVLFPIVFNSFAGGIVAVIGLRRSRQLAATSGVAAGRGFAIAGILIGFIWGVLTLLFIAAIIVFSIWAATHAENFDYSGGYSEDYSNS